MRFRIHFPITLFLFVVCHSVFLSNPASAQEFQFQVESGSTFAYLPSPWISNDYFCAVEEECDFNLSGTFRVSLREDGALLTLDSNAFTVDGIFLDPQYPASYDESDVLDWNFDGSELEREANGSFEGDGFQASFFDNDRQLMFSGGRDYRPADGDGVRFALTAVMIPLPDPDFDQNGSFECADVNKLSQEIAAGTNNIEFDLNGDGIVSADDLNDWLIAAGGAEQASQLPFQLGDIDLNGQVNNSDLGLLLNNFGTTGVATFCGGDLNADTHVNSTDLAYLLNNFGEPSISAAVPEPSSPQWFALGIAIAAYITRLKRR